MAALNVNVSIPAFVTTMSILIGFSLIVALRKFNLTSGKLFFMHLFSKTLWFFGIFLTGFNNYDIVNLGSLLFIVFGWGLGYTMLLFVLYLTKSEGFNKKFWQISAMFSIVFFLSFFLIPAYHVVPDNGGFYFKPTYYFLIPALILSFSYYYTIFVFIKTYLQNKKVKNAFYFLLFGIGLLIHVIPAHTIVILEFFFNQPHLILNMEYFSMIGFAMALYAYLKGFKKK